jgi:hypothetical protein
VYPLHLSKLSFKEIPGGVLTELRSETLLRDTTIRNGDTLYCTINLDVKKTQGKEATPAVKNQSAKAKEMT